MQLPDEIAEIIQDIVGIRGRHSPKQSRYSQRVQSLRKDMRRLAADFAAFRFTEARYTDAYFLYNFPTNLAKTAAVFEKIRQHYSNLFSDKRRLNVLDMGCGSGAGIYGTYYALRDFPGIQGFDFVGIDRSRSLLEQARFVARWLRIHDPRVRVHFSQKEIGGYFPLVTKKKYDLIMCINSLAEIIEGQEIPVRFINSMLNHLVKGGLLIVVEPALKKFSRRLMRLRNRLVSSKRMQLLLPCLHDSTCALLEVGNRKEWCHQSLPWKPPDFLRKINQGINREIDVLKFSYLVIAKNVKQLNGPSGHLVVSHLLKEKGKLRCYICTPKGRVELVRLDKSRSETNACFDRIRKGVILNLTDVAHKKDDYWQVMQDSAVKLTK